MVADVKKAFDVKPGSFFPPPKIHSSVVTLTPKQEQLPLVVRSKVKEIINLAFAQRRKMLKTSLKNISSDILQILETCGIEASLRAENLTIKDYIEIAKILVA
jgi:16S rRNA (adenine1518-N6/adenine1519-N6)-dimethyltransferase